jgi:hypothetical protein
MLVKKPSAVKEKPAPLHGEMAGGMRSVFFGHLLQFI